MARPRSARVPALARTCLPALLALGGAAAACSGAAPPPPRPPAKVAEMPPPAPPPPPPPARWVDSSGATAVGPEVEGGTLVLLGGRRAIVAADGSVRAATAPEPEPLREVIEVPSAGKVRLVARGLHGVYRLDDPLGPPVQIARSDAEVLLLGAAPGLCAVWLLGSDVPHFVDVETGQLRPMQGLPLPPLDAIAFRDARRGAAIFEAAGLAITADGGATWRLAAEATPGDAIRVRGLRARGGALRAFVHADGRDAAIDLAQARLGPMEDAAQPRAPEPPLLRWVRLTGRDPLEAAVASGAADGQGVAVAASHGLVARIDLATGAVLELAEFARGNGVNTCGVGGTERAAWVACALSEDAGEELYDPFGVLRVPLGAGRIAVERPALLRNGEAELRTSPSGGAMLLGPCNADDDGNACVRQPSGKWVTLPITVDLYDRGAGPLADGRMAMVRGLWEGDAPEPSDGGGEEGEGEGEGRGEGEAAVAAGPYIAVIDAAGHEQRVGSLSFRGGSSDEPDASPPELRVVSPIEEDEEHALSFVIASGEEVWAAVQPPGRGAAKLTRLVGMTHARVHQGHGVAVGGGQVQGSLDGGLTWAAVPAPPRVQEGIDRVDLYDEPGVLAVNEIGMKIDTQLRLGWGPPAASSEPAREPSEDGAPLSRSAPAPAVGPELALSCASQGPAQGAPPLLLPSEVSALLTRGAPPAPKGSERKVSIATQGRWGLLDAAALLEEQGPSKPGGAPLQWTLRWFDPTELGAKPRSWTGPAPKGVAWGSTVRAASASGGRALFTIRVGGKNLLVRVKSPGGIEVAEVSWELLPSTEVVFGADKGEPIAWLHDASVVVWLSGEQPRVIAQVATHANRTLGQPTKDGLPLLLSASDWSITRTLAIPPAPRAGAPSAAAAAIPLDGWSRAPNLRRDLGRFPACKAQPKGARYVIQKQWGDAAVDGLRERVQSAIYDVRVAGSEACVAQVAALLTPERGAAAAAGQPPKGKGTAAPQASGPVSFARIDLPAKRAEGGDRGTGTALRRLSCSLEPKQ